MIELLVVIAILLLLVAILLPVTSRTIEASRRTRCASNLHQIAGAMQMYLADHGAFYPKLTWDRQYEQCQLLHPYLTDPNVFICPTAQRDGSGGNTWPQYYSVEIDGIRFCTDYKMNDSNNLLNGKPTFAFVDPAAFILACDLDWTPVLRHTGKGNYVFLDGHVQLLNRTESDGSADPTGANRPWYDWGIQ